MTFPEQLQKALQLATTYHEGQVDLRGEPFILHVLRVGLAGKTEDEIIVGLLHDIVEDTEVTTGMLHDLGFPEHIVRTVSNLTRYAEESYHEYIAGVLVNTLALRVKRTDLLDNLAPWRQDFAGADKLRTRHEEALKIVEKAVGVVS